MNQHTNSFKDWWSKLGNATKRNQLSERKVLTAYIMWHIWKNRNRWIFSSKQYSEMKVVRGAWREWTEYKVVNHQEQEEIVRISRLQRKEPWKPPEA